MIKKALSMLLSLTLLMSLIVVPARAEGAQDGAQTVTLRMEPQSGEWKHTEYKGSDPSTYYTVKIFADSEFDTFIMNNAQIYFAYDTKVVSLRYAQMSSAEALAKIYDEDAGEMVNSPISMSYDKDAANRAGYATLVFTEGSGKNHVVPKGTLLATLRFTVNDGVESCAPQFAFKADNNLTILGARGIEHTVDDSATATVSINGIAPVLSRVTVSTDPEGANIILSSDKIDGADRYVVTVDGTTVTPYTTYYVHAYSAMGTDMTGSVDWKIGSGVGFAGTTFANGVIVVTPRAANIPNAHISATQAGAGENGKDLTVSTDKTFSVSRTQESRDTITSLSISCANTTLTVPTGSDPSTTEFKVDAKNIYDEKIYSPRYFWKITKDGAAITSGSGISLYASDNILKVTRNALANIGTYTVQAYSGKSFDAGVKSNEITVTIQRDAVKVSDIVIDTSTIPSGAVPKTGEPNLELPLPTVTVKDQYGIDVDSSDLTWKTMGSNDSGNPIEAGYPGVTIENGKLVVTNAAAKPALFPNGNTEFVIPVRVSCGDKHADFNVKLTREPLTATSVTVSGGPTAALLVPGSGEPDVTSNDEKFTAVVKDQYGQEIEGASVTWSAMMGSAVMTPVAGVEMTADGAVTVKSAAAETVFDTNAVMFTAIAEYNDAVVGYKNFTVARAASVATSITVAKGAGAEDTLLIPGLDSTEPTRHMEFVATVKDQYGAKIQNPSINWSISCGNYKMPDGVTIDPATGVVSVTIDAAKTIDDSMEHYIFTVTAAVNGTEIEDSTQTFKVKREDIRMIGFHLYATKDGEKDTPLTDNSTAIIADGTDFLFASWPYSQYGEEYTWPSIVWQVEIFAPDNSRAIPADTGKSTDSVPSCYCTKLPITSAVKDGTYRIVIAETNSKTGATPIKSEYSINLMRKQDAGLTISGGDNATSKTVTYGETFTLTANAANHDTTGSNWGLSGIDSTILDTVRHDGGNLTLKALKAGTTTFTMTYEDDKYYDSVTYTVTVDPKEVTAVLVNGAKVSKVYDGTTDVGSILPDNISAPVQLTGVIGTDELTVSHTLAGTYGTQNVHKSTDEFSLTLTLSGDAAGNYRLKNSSVAIPSEITPKPVSISELTFASRQFSMNNSSAEIDTLTFDGVVSGDTLTYETGLIRVANNNVGTQSVEAFTVTLTNGNYCWTADVVGSTLTIPANTYKVQITKAPYDPQTAETSTKFGNSASFPLKSDLFPAGANVQSITVTASTGSIFDGAPSVTGTTLNYKIKAKATPGQTGTLTLTVESQKYETYNITVTVTVLDKIAQTIEAANVTMIYGDSAQVTVTNASALHGAVSYTVTNGSDVISVDNGKITALKSGTATVRISVAGNDDYAATEKNITVEVAKRPINLRIDDKTGYVGEKMPALTFRILNVLAQDQADVSASLTPVVDNADAMKKTGRYEIHFAETVDSTSVTFPSEKYELGTVTNGTLTVTDRPIIDPTPMGSEITVIPAQDGTTKISTPKAVEGATVTITVTPDKDKELKSLEVIDENGSRLPLTDLGNGRFSFVMPAGKVSVSVVYGDVNDYVNPYLDVKTSDWYYEAVKYVTVNGLMNGTGANRFEPNLATSRAMIWTILARMSGVNTTGGSVWYAAAQQWAIATGVSDGTNPNGTITREQLAAMLYRYAVSKGMVTAPVTADLSIYSDAASVSAYAVEAMQWAVGTGLINGMNGKLNPQGSATRAQVATMLMRFAQLSK